MREFCPDPTSAAAILRRGLKSMLCLCALLVLLVGSAPTAFGLSPNLKLTQYVHRIWQTEPGLPPTSILWVTQSVDGYLWLGTESGVVRFDGVRFTAIPELERASLSDVWGWNVTRDSRGRIWLASNKYGIVRIGEDGVKVFTTHDGLPPGALTCIFATKSGDVWACTPAGMTRFRNDRLVTYGEGLTGPAFAGCESHDGKISIAGVGWAATSEGSRFNEVPLHSVPAGTGVRAIVCRDDGVWIGTRSGLVRLADGQEHRYTKDDGIADSEIFSLASGSHGGLWIGTREGFSRFIQGKFETYGYLDGLSQKDVISIFEDGEGSLWVATKFGLNQFLDGPTTRFTKNEGLPSDNVGPIIRRPSGRYVGRLPGCRSRPMERSPFFPGKRFIFPTRDLLDGVGRWFDLGGD